MNNLTSIDKDGRILVNGIYKVCNKPDQCSGFSCDETCIINIMIKRIYELEHKDYSEEER